MQIAVVGTGYVGLVAGACFADVGHQVCCVDSDASKVARLCDGDVPIYEPGLSALVAENLAHQRLTFTTDITQGIDFADVVFIAVDTPPCADGHADLSRVLAVAESIGCHISRDTVVVTKSTVPVGTGSQVEAVIRDRLEARGLTESVRLDVCANPEFLKEGAAIADFRKPDRVIVGVQSDHAAIVMRELYAPFNRHHDKLLVMDRASAELTKYAANAMLATKISFINEIANIAEHVGADIESVRQGIGSDPRIGYDFIYAGCGYGGACFPKDVNALNKLAEDKGELLQLIGATDEVNQRQKRRFLQRVVSHFGGDLQGKRIAVWGLAFKPGTDDVREATSAVIIEGLLARGAEVVAHDPHANASFARANPGLKQLRFCDQMMTALEGADALVICTEWRQFWSPDFEQMRALMRAPLVFDGRNLYNPAKMAELGFAYYGVGRGLSVRQDTVTTNLGDNNQ